jgi:hypothetical protein
MLNLDFKLRPSKYYLILITGVILMTEIILFSLSWKAIFLGGLLILIYGGHLIAKEGLMLTQAAIIGFKRQNNNQWLLYTQKSVLEGTLRGDSTVTTWVSVLRFNVSGHFWPVSCVIFNDALASDSYRKLLVAVRMGG